MNKRDRNETPPSEVQPGGSGISRREFCGWTVGGTLGALSIGVPVAREALAADAGAEAAAGPVVAVARDPKVWAEEGRKADPKRLRKLVDRAVCWATEKKNAREAWKTIVKPTDVVGLKINCLGGRGIVTRPELVDTVVQCLLDAGVPAGNVIIWDRNDRSLDRVGYGIRREEGKVRCMGTTDLGDKKYDTDGIPTRLSKLVTHDCSVIINMPVMKTHGLAGMSGALKNYMGAIPNPRDLHPGRCVAVGDLMGLKPLREKTRLVIMDALRPQYDRGPGDYPAARWNYHAIVASTQPLALDCVVKSMLEEKRREVRGQAWPIDAPHLKRAGKLGLGETDLKKIRVKRDTAV
jgi:uncharacterized protein (DUF362 family)